MTSKEKLVEKLLTRPANLRYSQIETLFKNSRYVIREWKWSHKRITFKGDTSKYVTIAIHKNDCKLSWKIALQEFYLLTQE